MLNQTNNEDEIAVRVIHCMHSKDREYIGRANAKLGLAESPLHNPYRLFDESQRASCLSKFRKYFSDKINAGDKIIMDEIYRLVDVAYTQGYINLGCWCKLKPPAPDRECHGDVIKEYLDRILNP